MSIVKTKEEQVKEIQRILGKPDIHIPDFRFGFGKHCGYSLEFVFKNDKQYLNWLYQSDVVIPNSVTRFIQREVLQ